MRRLAVACLLICCFASIAVADFPPGGLKVSRVVADFGMRDARIDDLQSDDLAVMAIGKGGNGDNYSLQRVSRSGVIASGWPADGVVLGGAVSNYGHLTQSFVVAPDGNYWHSWRSSPNAVAQFVTPAGVVTPAAFPNYFSMGTSSGIDWHAASIPNSGAYVTRGADRIMRVNFAGTPATGWTSTGFALPGFGFDGHALLPDGAGGVVVFMRTLGASSKPGATRIDSSRVVHAGWPAGGLVLRNVAHSDLSLDTALLPSGAAHFVAAWWEGTASAGQIYVQRFGLDGTLDPAWPANAVAAGVVDTITAMTVLADGSGGAYVLRHSDRKPLVTHVAVTGAIVGSPDTNPLDAGAQYVPTSVSQQGEPDKLIAAATPDGRLIVGWGDNRLAPTVTYRLRWLMPDLTPDPYRPNTGVIISPTTPSGASNAKLLDVHSDGDGGAFVAWGGMTVSTNIGEVWMTHVPEPESVGLPGASPNALALVLVLMGGAGALALLRRLAARAAEVRSD